MRWAESRSQDGRHVFVCIGGSLTLQRDIYIYIYIYIISRSIAWAAPCVTARRRRAHARHVRRAGAGAAALHRLDAPPTHTTLKASPLLLNGGGGARKGRRPSRTRVRVLSCAVLRLSARGLFAAFLQYTCL